MIREQLEALERKRREAAECWREKGTPYGDAAAITFADCADDLRTLLDGCAGEVKAVGYVSTRAAEALRGLSPNGVLMTSIRKSGDVPIFTHPPAVVVDEDMLNRAVDAWDDVYDGVSHNRVAAMRAAITAALQRDRQP